MKIVIGLYIFDYLTGGERSNILVNGESWFKVHSRRRHAHHAPTLMLVSSMAEPSFLHKVSVGTESFESMTLHSPPFVVPFVKCFSGCFVAFVRSFVAFTSFFVHIRIPHSSNRSASLHREWKCSPWESATTAPYGLLTMVRVHNLQRRKRRNWMSTLKNMKSPQPR